MTDINEGKAEAKQQNKPAVNTAERPQEASHESAQYRISDESILELIERSIDDQTSLPHLQIQDDSSGWQSDPKITTSVPAKAEATSPKKRLFSTEERNSITNQQNVSPANSPFSKCNKNSVLISSSFKRRVMQESVFNRQDSHISMCMENELPPELLVEAVPQPQGKSWIFPAASSQARTEMMLAISNFCYVRKLEVVRCSNEELVVRKRQQKSFVEQFLLTFREPIVLQFLCRREQEHLRMNGIAGSLDQFKQWRDEFEVVLWQTGHLPPNEDIKFRVFMLRHRMQVQRLRRELASSRIKPAKEMTDRKNRQLFGGFSKFMDLRETLLTQLHLESIGSVGCVRELDRKLLEASGLIDFHRCYCSLLEREFVKRRKEVANIQPSSCLEGLEVDQEFRLSTSSAALPYQRAIGELNTLPQKLSVEEKLTCVVRYYQLIRECVSDHYGGSHNVVNMDNMLPLVIYTLLYSSADELMADMTLLENHISYQVESGSDCQMERRIILNVQVAMEYIITSWDATGHGKGKCW